MNYNVSSGTLNLTHSLTLFVASHFPATISAGKNLSIPLISMTSSKYIMVILYKKCLKSKKKQNTSNQPCQISKQQDNVQVNTESVQCIQATLLKASISTYISTNSHFFQSFFLRLTFHGHAVGLGLIFFAYLISVCSSYVSSAVR